MAISESLVVANAETDAVRRELAVLEQVSNANLSGVSSVDLGLIAQVKAFSEWLSDPRPAFRRLAGEEDKFANLVALSRKQQDCANFYVTEVGVDASTVWRWSTGKSRPSKFVGQSLAREIEARVRSALYEMVLEQGLANKVGIGAVS